MPSTTLRDSRGAAREPGRPAALPPVGNETYGSTSSAAARARRPSAAKKSTWFVRIHQLERAALASRAISTRSAARRRGSGSGRLPRSTAGVDSRFGSTGCIRGMVPRSAPLGCGRALRTGACGLSRQWCFPPDPVRASSTGALKHVIDIAASHMRFDAPRERCVLPEQGGRASSESPSRSAMRPTPGGRTDATRREQSGSRMRLAPLRTRDSPKFG